MRTFLVLLTLFLLAVTAENLLGNPGFEDGLTVSWQLSSANAVEGVSCATGDKCVRITSGGWAKQQVSLLAERDPVDAFEARLVVSAKVRAQPGTRGHVIVTMTDSSETHAVHVVPFALPTSDTNDFVAFDHRDVIAIRGARTAILEISVEEGEAVVDDLNLSVAAATASVECTVGEGARYGATAYGRPEFPDADSIKVNGVEKSTGMIDVSVEAPALAGGIVAVTWSPQPELERGGPLVLGEHDSLDARKVDSLTWLERSQLATSTCSDLESVRGDLANSAFGWELYPVDDRTLGQRFVKSVFELNRAKRADGSPLFALDTREGSSFTVKGTAWVVLALPISTLDETAGYSARVYPVTITVTYETVLEIETPVDNLLTDRSVISSDENGLIQIAVSVRGEALANYEVLDIGVTSSTFALTKVKRDNLDDNEVVVLFKSEDVYISDTAIDFRAVFDVVLRSRGDPGRTDTVRITMSESYSVHELSIQGKLDLQLHLCDVSGQLTSVVSSEERYRAIMWYHEVVPADTFTLISLVMVHEDGTSYHIIRDGEIAPAGTEGEARFLDVDDGLTILDQFGLEYRPGLVASTKSGRFQLHIEVHIDASVFEASKRMLEAAGHTVRDGGVVQDQVGVRQLIVTSELTVTAPPLPSPTPPPSSASAAAVATLLTVAVTMATLLFV